MIIVFEKLCKFTRLFFCIERIWSVGFFDQDSIKKNTITRWSPLKNEIYSFYADPYIYKDGECFLVFVEEFYYLSRKGGITLLIFDANLNLKSKKALLNDNQHYSFPRIFSLNKKKYLTVENISSGKGFQYYELSETFDILKSHRLMIDFDVVDPILLISENEIYLSFNSDREVSNYNKNSYLIKMKSFDFSVIDTPVLTKSNLYGTRNAGLLSFSQYGEMIYSQVSTPNTYGYALVATDMIKNKKKATYPFITRLTPRSLGGEKKYLGVHTINNSEDIFVFDFVEYRFNWFRFLFRFLTIINKLFINNRAKFFGRKS
jgi:hypothetical protein